MLRNLFFGKAKEQSEESDSDSDIYTEQNEKVQVIEHVKIISEDGPEVAQHLGARTCFGYCAGRYRRGDSDSSNDKAPDQPVHEPGIVAKQPTKVPPPESIHSVLNSEDEVEDSDLGNEAQESYHGDELDESDPGLKSATQWPSHNSGGVAEGSIENPSSVTKRPAEDSGDEAQPPAKVPKTTNTRLSRTTGREFVLPSPSTSAETSSERQSGAAGTQPSLSHASAVHGTHDSSAFAGRDLSPTAIDRCSYVGQDGSSDPWDFPTRRESFPSNVVAVELLRPFSQRRRLDGQSWPQNWPKAIPSPTQQLPLWEISSPINIPGTPQSSKRSARHPSDSEDGGDEASRIAAAYRRQGAQFQAWIEDSNAPRCPALRSNMTWDDLVAETIGEERMEADSISTGSNLLRPPPLEVEENLAPGLALDNVYRRVHFQRFAHGQVGWSWNLFIHRTGPGVLFVENIRRVGGPYWSEVAQAVYSMDHDINTLRYVYFLNVMNHETRGYAHYTLYPRLGRPHLASDHATHILEYGTQEYQELLGTQLGRGVARLVLGAWDRGSHRIERIYIWAFLGNVQLRFDLRAL
jgi:hypothetical protein